MTHLHRLLRGVLASAVVLGLVGLLAAPASVAYFDDAHDGEASVEAADDFGKGGPTAEAGGPYTVDEGNSVTLDGRGSSGKVKSYSWQITSGPGSLSGSTSSQPTYNAPSNMNGDTTVTVELTVTDNKGNTDTDTATVTVKDVGGPEVPSVDSLTVTKTGNRYFQIDASVSDPAGDGDTLDQVTVEVIRTKNNKVAYSNTVQVSGDSASISDTTSKLGNKQQYEVRVTVTDTDGGDSDTDTVTKSTG